MDLPRLQLLDERPGVAQTADHGAPHRDAGDLIGSFPQAGAGAHAGESVRVGVLPSEDVGGGTQSGLHHPAGGPEDDPGTGVGAQGGVQRLLWDSGRVQLVGPEHPYQFPGGEHHVHVGTVFGNHGGQLTLCFLGHAGHALDGMIHNGRETKIQENALNDNFYKKEFQTLWNYINHKYAYTVEFDSEELIQKAVAHIDEELFVSELRYTVTVGEQEYDLNVEQLKSGTGFVAEHSKTFTLKRTESSSVRYDLIGKIAEGAKLSRKSAARILADIRADKFAMFKNNPEEFIVKVIRLINEQKANMIVEQISYNQIEGTYDSTIFTAEKNTDFARAYRAKKNVQDYVFTDGYARDGQSVERTFAEEMDLADEVCVYTKLPRGFSIPTPVGNYSPDWAIAFHKGTVKHIFFIAETKGTMETLNLKPIESAKIQCAKKLFAQLSDCSVVYDVVKTYQDLLDMMKKM